MKIYLDRRGIFEYIICIKWNVTLDFGMYAQICRVSMSHDIWKGGVQMSITSDILRGHTEAIILSHLLEQDSYGYQINKDIMKKTDNRYELKEATLYSAFRRLEQSGYIRTYWGDETVGARRRYYAITEDGRKAYQDYKRDWEEAKVTIDQLLK